MGGFLETTKSFSLTDWYDNYYQKATVKITVSAAGAVNWSITMNNDRSGSKGRGVYLYVKIADKVVKSAGYTSYSNSNSSSWLTYPTGNGSSKTDSFTLSKTSSSSFDVTIHICCMQSDIDNGQQETFTFTRAQWGNVEVGTCSVQDNGDNSLTLFGTKGDDGTGGNTASGPTLNWGYTKDYNGNYTGEGAGGLRRLTIATPSDPYRTVYVRSITTGKYGDTATATGKGNINQYVAPGKPGVPDLSPDSLKNGRLTIKQNWTYTWTAAVKANDSSPVKGYRIYIYKNAASTPTAKVPYLDKWIYGLELQDGVVVKGNGSNGCLDLAANTNSITIDPVSLGFKPGDSIQVGIFAWAENGKGKVRWSYKIGDTTYSYSLWSGGGNEDGQVYSSRRIVENAGVVRVKAGGTWKEGQVWVKANGTWKEATSVHTKVNGSWKEST